MRKSHEAGQLGNKFGIVGVELPVGIENPLMRLYEVHRRMQALKQSLEPPVTLGLFAVLGYAPQMLQDRLFNLLIHRATAVMTNVPGPQTPLYLGGAEIKQVMFWVPQSGDIGMGVSILSYNGMVQFGLVTDAQMAPDPEAIIEHFRPQFDQLVYHVLMSSWGDADLEAAEQATLHSETETPKAPARKSRPASKPRAKGARTKSAPDVKSAAPPEPDAEAPVAEARKSRLCFAAAHERNSDKTGAAGAAANSARAAEHGKTQTAPEITSPCHPGNASGVIRDRQKRRRICNGPG